MKESRRKRVALAVQPPPQSKPSRTLVIGMGSIVSVLVLMLLLGGWGTGMTLMLLFGDRLSERLIVQNSEMQDAYEQRLQAYRAEIARVVLEMEQSKFDQNSVEGRIIDLGRRQRLIESRLQALNRLTELVAPGAAAGSPTLTPSSPQNGAKGSSPAEPPSKQAVPSGIKRMNFSDHGGGAPPHIETAQFLVPPPVETGPTQSEAEIDEFIDRLGGALTRAEQSQMRVLRGLVSASETRVSRLKLALREIGVAEDSTFLSKARSPVIPNIVLPVSDQTGPFADAIGRVRSNFGLMHRMKDSVQSLPIIKPTVEEVRYSSGFGYRIHPIHGGRRLHAGIDMAAATGTPVRAAGSGVVLSAGWGGGYGNLIQVDHGNGLVSRYAHLSEIGVASGQPVSSGQFLGRVGSTGASTGAHLHFETRIHGTPNNPACFLIAGDHLTGRNTVTLTCDKPPVWSHMADEEEDDDS